MSPQALNEEKVAYDRSPSKNVYLNVAVNTLKKLRGLAPGSSPGLNSKSGLGGGGLGRSRLEESGLHL